MAAAYPRSITGPSKPLGRSKSRILGYPENPRGESQIRILTTKADQEPILQIDLEGKTTPMMVDIGAVYNCVNSNYASHLPRKIRKDNRILRTNAANSIDSSSVSTNKKLKCNNAHSCVKSDSC